MKNEKRIGGYTFLGSDSSHNVFGGDPVVLRHQRLVEHDSLPGIELVSAVVSPSAAASWLGLSRVFEGSTNV